MKWQFVSQRWISSDEGSITQTCMGSRNITLIAILDDRSRRRPVVVMRWQYGIQVVVLNCINFGFLIMSILTYCVKFYTHTSVACW